MNLEGREPSTKKQLNFEDEQTQTGLSLAQGSLVTQSRRGKKKKLMVLQKKKKQ